MDNSLLLYTSQPVAPTAANQKEIAGISDWSISTRKRRIHIHYRRVFSGKKVDKNNIQFQRVLIKKVYNF